MLVSGQQDSPTPSEHPRPGCSMDTNGDQWQTLHQLQHRQTLLPSHFINTDLFTILSVTVGCLAYYTGMHLGEVLKEASEYRALFAQFEDSERSATY